MRKVSYLIIIVILSLPIFACNSNSINALTSAVVFEIPNSNQVMVVINSPLDIGLVNSSNISGFYFIHNVGAISIEASLNVKYHFVDTELYIFKFGSLVWRPWLNQYELVPLISSIITMINGIPVTRGSFLIASDYTIGFQAGHLYVARFCNTSSELLDYERIDVLGWVGTLAIGGQEWSFAVRMD